MQSIRIPDLIQKKRDKHPLEDEEVRFFVRRLVDGTLEGCQLGAMLMAWYFNGMSARELATLIDSMTHSGDTLSWPEEWSDILVDKHSTGGVGDKVSLVLAPALAACGLKVPMISGRGLGFTGGTLDKLESITGFNVKLTNKQMRQCLSDAGCCIAGQTDTLVPADRLMYAARDVTATIDNIYLATASIISKKAAESIRALVLDVKVGRATFFKTMDDARRVAQSLVDAARDQGIHTSAVLTAMDTPIGKAVGNSLEVMESIATLRGNGPDDLVELVAVEGGQLLHSIGKADSMEHGRQMIIDTLTNGEALNRFERMLVNQNVDPDLARSLCSGAQSLPLAKYRTPLTAKSSGYVTDIDALSIGSVCGALGAARARAADVIEPGVGLLLSVDIGQVIQAGQVWAELHHERQVPDDLMDKLSDAIVVEREWSVSGASTRILQMVE